MVSALSRWLAGVQRCGRQGETEQVGTAPVTLVPPPIEALTVSSADGAEPLDHVVEPSAGAVRRGRVEPETVVADGKAHSIRRRPTRVGCGFRLRRA